MARCEQGYGVILVDLFHGDGTPEYLFTRNFFADLRRCLAPRGIAVFNTIAVADLPTATAHLLVTLRSEFPHLALYRPEWPGAPHVNQFLVASASPLPTPRPFLLDALPTQHAETLPAMLERPLPLEPELFASGEVMTDLQNPGVYDIARSQLRYRRALVASLPAAFLVD
jgi:hypothetical protein